MNTTFSATGLQEVRTHNPVSALSALHDVAVEAARLQAFYAGKSGSVMISSFPNLEYVIRDPSWRPLP